MSVSCCLIAMAQSRPQVSETGDSVKIYFRQSKIDLLPDFHGNGESLRRISDSLRNTYSDSVYRLKRIHVVGGGVA